MERSWQESEEEAPPHPCIGAPGSPCRDHTMSCHQRSGSLEGWSPAAARGLEKSLAQAVALPCGPGASIDLYSCSRVEDSLVWGRAQDFQPHPPPPCGLNLAPIWGLRFIKKHTACAQGHSGAGSVRHRGWVPGPQGGVWVCRHTEEFNTAGALLALPPAAGSGLSPLHTGPDSGLASHIWGIWP